MNGQMDKSLFFITLSAVCVWLIVDMAVGKDHLGNFLSTLFPFMDSSGSSGSIELTEEQEENLSQGKADNAPTSSAAGSNNRPNGTLNNENPYGANRPKGGRSIE